MTQAGQSLLERSGPLLDGLEDALAVTSGIAGTPKGTLTISAGIGIGINVLGAQLPAFLVRYPDVRVSIDLTSRVSELVAERVDVAIRMGPLSDSSMVATRLGTLTQYLCATPAYLDQAGRPGTPSDLARHQLIDLPSASGRARPWRLTSGDEEAAVEPDARIEVNDALTIRALVNQDVGIAIVSAYLCGPDILTGGLERVLPDWSLPPLPVHLVFPSRREIAPVVRAFVDYMREANESATGWLADPLAAT